MNKEDLRQIKSIIDESLETHTLKCIKPAFDDVYNRFDKMDKRFDKMDKRMNHIENQMVTKDYLDEKMADLKGDTVVRDRKIDEKANIANESLERNKFLGPEEVKRLADLQVFPSIKQLKQELAKV